MGDLPSTARSWMRGGRMEEEESSLLKLSILANVLLRLGFAFPVLGSIVLDGDSGKKDVFRVLSSSAVMSSSSTSSSAVLYELRILLSEAGLLVCVFSLMSPKFKPATLRLPPPLRTSSQS